MRSITATDFRHRFAEHLETLGIEPILVEKGGRPVAVVLSIRDYERLQAIEDAYWGELAKEAEKMGFLTQEETVRWVQERMNAQIGAQ